MTSRGEADPLAELDAHDLVLLALALESFVNEARRGLKEMDAGPFMRTTRQHLEQQIAQLEALLRRVIDARRGA